MPVAASRVMDFLEKHEFCVVERNEIASAAFGILRRSLRRISLILRESEDQDSLEISGRVKALLSECLTVPVPFDRSISDAMTYLLGDSAVVRVRWGSDISILYDSALHAAEDLASIGNPVREKLHAVIRELKVQERKFKIYCHRVARTHFESIFDAQPELLNLENAFLHSVRDYREAMPFDVLIKVGPLRTRGWGSAPDALVTAPRFKTLVQIVWAGCSE